MAAKRRAQGEGALYQRGDHKWEAVLHLGYGPGGERKKLRRVRTTKREAALALEEMKVEVAGGLDPAMAKVTVGQWLCRWLADEAAPSVRPRTLDSYEGAIRLHLLPALGHIRLRELTASQVRAYLNAKLGETSTRTGRLLSAQTVNNTFIALRRALEIATRYGFVEKNVAKLVAPPRSARAEVRPLDREEARRFLEAARGHQLESLFVLAASTGMRQGELLGLRWTDIDLVIGAVRVSHTLQRYARAFHLDPPKTERSRRSVSVPSQVSDALRRRRVQQAEHRLAAGPDWTNDDWGLAFTDELGRPLHNRSVNSRFEKVLDAAGVRRVRFHDLRHGAATFLLAQGVPMKVVSDMLGHSQIGITMDTYSHVLPELHRDAADRIGAVLFT